MFWQYEQYLIFNNIIINSINVDKGERVGGLKKKNWDTSCVFNPSLIGVVLQTHLQFNDIIIQKLKFGAMFTPHHILHVTCHESCVKCHIQLSGQSWMS